MSGFEACSGPKKPCTKISECHCIRKQHASGIYFKEREHKYMHFKQNNYKTNYVAK